MNVTTHFNCKQNEKHNFLCYLILGRITDTKISIRGSGIRVSWVDFSETLINGGGTCSRDSRAFHKTYT